MAIDFSTLKKSRGNFESLMKEVDKIATPQAEGSQKDERFWQPEVDKAGNGYAVIRFLPPPKGRSSLGSSLEPCFPRSYWKVVY